MRARLTLWLALASALLLLFLSASYLLYARHELEGRFAASLDRLTPEAAILERRGAPLDELRAAIEFHNASVTQSGAISERIEAWLLDSHGRVVWRIGPPRRPKHSLFALAPPLVPPIPPLDDPGGWRTRAVSWHGQKLLLALPWHRSQADLRAQALALALLSLLVTGGAALGAWTLVGKTLRPIDALALQAADSARTSPLMERREPLRPTSRDREMQHLVFTLNAMLDRVRESALSKERFHTSASHELRTPLAALSGHLGVALSRERSAADYRLALEEAERQTNRLSKLTGDLLLLNRLQTAASAPPKERLDVAETCDIALQRAGKTIAARGLRVVDELEPLEVEAPPSHVEILLGNLVENAAKYARTGGAMGVTIEGSSSSVRVWNECEPAQWAALQSELPRLFEPFYRPDAARASATGGNGLGLAICRSVAEANGWSLLIEAQEPLFALRVFFGTTMGES